MKKFFLLVAAMISTTMFAQLQVATFENIELAEESVLHLAETGTFENGSFSFQQEVSVSDWGTYYYGNIPSNKSDNEFESYLDAEKSAKGGAYEGKNFVVWTASYMGIDAISLSSAAVVPGFFINNTAYDVNSMLNGDAYAKRFEKDDWFKLTITGLKETVAGKSVDFYLAKDGKYVNEWTYVDLSELGEIDGIQFSLSSSDTGEYGMNTPAYFCMDNFGAEKPAEYVEPARAEFPKVVDINITSGVIFTNAVEEEGWWQVIAEDETYALYICLKDETTTQIAGTYTIDDIDEEYSDIEYDEDYALFTGGSITASVDEETGNITFTGKLTGEDGVIYNIYIVYSEPKAEKIVEVNITEGELDRELAEFGWYVASGTDANGVFVQLSIWPQDEEAPFAGDFTEDDFYYGSFVAEGEDDVDIYTATIHVVPGNKEGEYSLTADLLCYNNTLYKVTMLIPATEDAIENILGAENARKLIRDGQVVIIRDGKAINMQGAFIR